MKYGSFRGKASKTAGNRAFGPTLPCESALWTLINKAPLPSLFFT